MTSPRRPERDHAIAIDKDFGGLATDTKGGLDISVIDRHLPRVSLSFRIRNDRIRAFGRINIDGDEGDLILVVGVNTLGGLQLRPAGRSPACEEIDDDGLIGLFEIGQ